MLYTKAREMTFEERIDRLTERHEALAQTVELIAIEHQRNEAMQQKNQILIAQVIEGIHDLARIAEGHERRISGLEGG